jgi:hypothetical protein
MLCVTMPRGGMSKQEFDAHLAYVEGLLLKGERFALLVDARGAQPLQALQRQALAGLLQRSFERDPLLLAGLGFVLGSAVERGILTAIFWAAGPSYPRQTFRTPEEAAEWLLGALGSEQHSRSDSSDPDAG